MLRSQTDKSSRTALVVGCGPQIEANDGPTQDGLPVRGACRQPSLGKPAIEPKDCCRALTRTGSPGHFLTSTNYRFPDIHLSRQS